MVSVVQELRHEVEDVLKGLSVELVDMELVHEGGRLFLRISIDKKGEVNVEDCATVSEVLDKLIEQRDLIEEPFTLEVMSPGVDRALRKPGDFERFKGRTVVIKLADDHEGYSNIEGKLLEAEEESFLIEHMGKPTRIEYVDISGANLKPDLPW